MPGRHAPCIPKVSKKTKKPQPRAEVFLNWQSLCKRRYAGCRAYILPSNGTQPLLYIQLAFFSACLASHWAFFSAYCSSLRLCHPQHFPVGLRPQPHVFASAMSVSCSRFSDKLVNVCVFLYVTGRQADGLAGVRPVDFLSCGNMAV